MLVNRQEQPIRLAGQRQVSAAALGAALLPAPTVTLPHWMLWNQTEAAFTHDQCVHHLFENQALRTPDASAICFIDHVAILHTHNAASALAPTTDRATLTYRELNQRANQLAHHLQTQGVGP